MGKPSRKLASGVAGVLLGAGLLGGAIPVHAEEANIELDISGHYVEAGANLSGPLFVVDENGNQYSATLKDDHTVTYKTEVSAGCSWYNMVVPFGGAWHTSVNGCSLIGVNNSATHEYRWDVDNNSKGIACLKGRGYYLDGYWREKWDNLGCGKGANQLVTIGKVITVAKVQGQSIGSTGTALFWQ
jgi:hypothetical protein